MKKFRLALIALVSLAGCEASVQSRPAGYARYEPAPAPAYRPAPGRPAAPDGRWITLADRYSAESNRQYIAIKGQDAFRRIRIEADRGAPVIRQVAIEFADTRDTQVVKLDARIAPGQGQTIDLNGGRRPVQRIVVYTDGGPGSYSVFGV
jgi:hypothetical protein